MRTQLKNAIFVGITLLTGLALVGWASNEVSIGGVSVLSDSTDVTFHVNASTGSNYNDGLDSTRALATIQEAVDRLPRLITGNYKISLADGTYFEQVNIVGIKTAAGGTLLLEGDPDTPTDVVITGSNSRSFGINVVNTNVLEIDGLKIINIETCGIVSYNHSIIFLRNIEVTDIDDRDARGIQCAWHSEIFIEGNVKSKNTWVGIEILSNSYVRLNGGTESNKNQFNGNKNNGIHVATNACLLIDNATVYIEINNNDNHGIHCELMALFTCRGSGTIDIKNNGNASGEYGIKAAKGAKVFGNATITLDGNYSGGYAPTSISSGGSVVIGVTQQK